MPLPLLVALGLAALAVLVYLIGRRRGDDRGDLLAPPSFAPPTAPRPPQANPAQANPAQANPAQAYPAQANPAQGWPAPLPPGATASGLPPALDLQVRALLGADRKIEAIKLVKDTTRLGLAESKALVDRM